MKRSLPPAPALVALLIGAGLLLLAACDDNGGDGAQTPTDTSVGGGEPMGTPDATASLPTPTAVFEGTRGPVEQERTDQPAAILVDVRTGHHEGFDRVVFEFDIAIPGYRIEYVQSPITACGSGLTVTIAGDAFLQVRMTPAAAHDGQGNVTVDTTELTPGLPAILEVESTCDFEGEVTWVVGLNEEVDFSVFELSDPPRLVIDVLHP